MRSVAFSLLAGVSVAIAGSSVEAQQRTIGGPAGIPGAIWADKNNDGYVDGYVYKGKYYAGVPAGSQGASRPPPAHDQQGSRSYAGVGLQQIDEPLANALNIAPFAGEFVQTVVPDSPAARAGLVPGDVIVAVNGHNVSKDIRVADLIVPQTPGSPVEVAILRHGNRTTFTIIPVARPSEQQLAALAGDQRKAAEAHPAAAREIQAPDSVAGFRDSHLAMVGDETRFGFTQVVPGQSYTVVLLSCSRAPDFAMSAARPIALNQPRSGYYLSTLSLQTNKSDVWYRLRAASKQDVGEPFTIALIKGASATDADLEALRPICPAAATTAQEIRRRWGQLADMDHKSLVFTNGKEVFDFDWIVPGKSMIQYRRNYGDKYTNSAGHLLSWDERRQKIHSQYISAGVIEDEYFTPGIKVANIIPYEDDRRRAKLARASSGGGGGGLGGFLKGAIAGAAGMAMGASPETATESAIAGAVAGGFLGAKGEDAGMIGSAAAQGSAQGTAEVEASNAELRRIAEQGIRSASSGGSSSGGSASEAPNSETAAESSKAGSSASSDSIEHFVWCWYFDAKNPQTAYVSRVGHGTVTSAEQHEMMPSKRFEPGWRSYLDSAGLLNEEALGWHDGLPPAVPYCAVTGTAQDAEKARESELTTSGSTRRIAVDYEPSR